MAIRIEKETKINNEADHLKLEEQIIRNFWSNENAISEFIRSALKPNYDDVGHFHEGLAWFKLKAKF